METTSEIETTEDWFLGGRVKVLQPAVGYRAGLDAVLLAASLEVESRATVAEAGCGVGAALLCAASRLSEAHFVGFDRIGQHVGLMEQSAVANGFGERVLGEVMDIAERPLDLENRFDQAFSNPPYFRPDAVRAPSEGRKGAYLAETPLLAWVRFLHHVTAPGGRITMIHRAGELASILAQMEGRCGEIEIMPVRPYPGAAAKRVLVRGRKGLRSGDVRLLDGVELAERQGGPQSAVVRDVMAGDGLKWS